MLATVNFLHLTRVSVKISIRSTHEVGTFLLTILVAVPASNKYECNVHIIVYGPIKDS